MLQRGSIYVYTDSVCTEKCFTDEFFVDNLERILIIKNVDKVF